MATFKHYQKNTSGDSPIINVAAGAAANTTYTAYLDMAGYDAGSLQIEWTAGAAGTLDCKFYASLQDDGTAVASCAFQDVTTVLFGVVSIAGDAITLDGDSVVGNVKWFKVSATIANKDANTALIVYARLKKN